MLIVPLGGGVMASSSSLTPAAATAQDRQDGGGGGGSGQSTAASPMKAKAPPTGPCSSAMAANSIGVILNGDASLSVGGAGAMNRLKEDEKKIQMVRDVK